MGRVFSKDKKDVPGGSRITEQDQAILKLKKQRDELKKYQKKISAVLESDRLLAKKLLKEGKKDRAKLLLRKKRFQEGLLEKTDGQLDNLERLVHDLEFAQVEKQVLDGLKVGNEALKKANDMFSIDEIEQILEDSAEAAAKQDEINAMLSGQLSAADEDDVLKELDQLIQEDESAEAEKKAEQLPEVPGEELPGLDQSEEEKSERKKKSPKQKEKVALEA